MKQKEGKEACYGDWVMGVLGSCYGVMLVAGISGVGTLCWCACVWACSRLV